MRRRLQQARQMDGQRLRLVRRTVGERGRSDGWSATTARGGIILLSMRSTEEHRTIMERRREAYLSAKRDILDPYRANPHPEGVNDSLSTNQRRGPYSELIRWLVGTLQTKLRAAIHVFDDRRMRRAHKLRPWKIADFNTSHCEL